MPMLGSLAALMKLGGRYPVSGRIFRAHVAGALEGRKTFLKDLEKPAYQV